MKSKSSEEIEHQLVHLFNGSEWPTYRYMFRHIEDKNPFVSATIIAILNHCSIKNPDLLQCILKCKRHLKTYQKKHQTYHWPFKKGYSLMPNSSFFGKLTPLALSPDADCSVLQQLALQNPLHIKALLNDLQFYRYDRRLFRLSHLQEPLSPHLQGSFLTWFPPKNQCTNLKMETVDIVVMSNILWFLGEVEQTTVSGYSETSEAIIDMLYHPLLVKNPYRFSPYYPFLHHILYAVSRMIVWGKNTYLVPHKEHIIRLAKQIKITSSAEYLSIRSIEAFFQTQFIKHNTSYEVFDKSPFYILAFTEAFHSLEWISKQPTFQIKFYSEALHYAMLRWLKEATNEE